MRPIINLKGLNKFVSYHHFKMETLEFALTLIRPKCFLASMDLKDAYFTIPMAHEHQKFLRFQWQNKLWQFTCLCFGLASAPRIFTKLLKPVTATLRNMGHISANYLDDSLLIGDTVDECTCNVQDRCSLVRELGFVINEAKSHFTPTQVLDFLGFTINTIEMTVRLPPQKVSSVVNLCRNLASQTCPTILLVAQVIGKLVSCFPAVPLGPLFYRSLEIPKDYALKTHNGNFQARMSLTREAKSDLKWWVQNLSSTSRPILPRNADVQVYTDASCDGWGASFPEAHIHTNGRWKQSERVFHINYLELLAVLQCFNVIY